MTTGHLMMSVASTPTFSGNVLNKSNSLNVLNYDIVDLIVIETNRYDSERKPNTGVHKFYRN